MKLMKVIICAFVLSSGCASARLTEEGDNVRVISASRADGCVYVSSVSATVGANFHSYDDNVDNAMTELRNKAAARGADAVVVNPPEARDDSALGRGCRNCVSISGQAYRCRSGRGYHAEYSEP